MTLVGTPVRPNVIDAATTPYEPPRANDTLRLIVFGGSQGAKVFADVMPDAIAALDPALRNRLAIVQQARGEDRGRVRTAYEKSGIDAEVADFFTDLPHRIADSHLVVSRSGASTVAEVTASRAKARENERNIMIISLSGTCWRLIASSGRRR